MTERLNGALFVDESKISLLTDLKVRKEQAYEMFRAWQQTYNELQEAIMHFIDDEQITPDEYSIARDRTEEILKGLEK